MARGFDRLHPALQHHIVNSLGWAELRPTQEATIDPILEGEHALVLAPTAGGKTEAAMIPVLSRMLSEQWQGLSVLYVCPIRALLNNLEPRISRYCELVGRRAAVWHGDVADSGRRRILRDPPDVLLTTPESLEAMLISTRVDHQVVFAELRTLIIDELHAFAGDDRGWHLLALAERLEVLARRQVQRIGLSATLGNPADLAVWMAGDGRAPARVVMAESSPPGSPEVILDYVGSLDNAARVIGQLHRGEKRLVFCDSRARVEELALGLRGHGVSTFVSHSSLGVDERRRAEEAFADGNDCVIVATSTLELGLDVGDLDRVIQIDAPGTVSSFLQRLGRTGRRAGTSRNCLFLATEEDAFLRAAGLLQLWSQGFVEPVKPPPAPWHLFAQQVMALVLQENGIERRAWKKWVGKTPAFAKMRESEIEAILSYMLEAQILHEDGGLLSFGLEGERRFGKRHFMDLVSAFTTPPLFLVRYGKAELGQVHHSSFITREDRPPVLLLGGRTWAVTELDWPSRVAWVEPTKEEGHSRWRGSSGALRAELCQSINKVLIESAAIDAFLSRRGKELLDQLRGEFSWCRSGTTSLVCEGGRVIWWTFAGILANGMLAGALEAAGIAVKRVDNFWIRLGGEPNEAAEAIAKLTPEDLRPIVPPTAGDDLKFSAALPPDSVAAVLSARLSDLKAAVEVIGRPVSICRPAETREAEIARANHEM